MNLLIFIFFCAGAAVLYLLFRFILFRLGFKDSNYPIVQRAERKGKALDTSMPFLPGSRMESLDLEKTLSQTIEVEKAEKKKKKKKNWFSQEELKHAIILEELLHPKFKHAGHDRHQEVYGHGESEGEDGH